MQALKIKALLYFSPANDYSSFYYIKLTFSLCTNQEEVIWDAKSRDEST